jgi:hypothetical protein
LQKAIAEIRTEMMTECEAVLTDAQKQLLSDRRRAAAGRRVHPPAAEPPASTKTAQKADD